MRYDEEAQDRRAVAVTGASGYIGAALVDALAENSPRLLRVSRKRLVPIARVRTIEADVRTAQCWRDIVQHADVIYHLAGSTSVYGATRDPADCLSATVLPINHLVQAAAETGRHPRVVFASTATVYGVTGSNPVAETTEPTPVTVYDLHKLFAERQLALASRHGVLEGVSLRLSNVYGWSASAPAAEDRGVLNRVTAKALEGQDLVLYGEGYCLRDYVHIDDVVRAFIAAGNASCGVGEVFNVATGRSVSILNAFRTVARLVAEATGREVQIKKTAWPDDSSPIEFRSYVADVARIRAEFGWVSETSLEEGLSRMIEALRRE